jgi:hypothetical protein
VTFVDAKRTSLLLRVRQAGLQIHLGQPPC